jgi:hypothetical protein
VADASHVGAQAVRPGEPPRPTPDRVTEQGVKAAAPIRPAASPKPALTARPTPAPTRPAASRSVRRPRIAPPRRPQPTSIARPRAVTPAMTGVTSGDPRSIARSMLAQRGWSSQFGCLDSLWSRESGWSTTAGSPSGPYGIPQALPGSKMASEGSDWASNPATQIRWGLGYISSTYGSPCAAWGHSQSTGWY